MKPYIPYSLLLAAASCGMAYGAATAYTTPVGYITHSIVGAGTDPSADTYISASLVQPSVYAGASDAAPSGSTITFAGTSVPTGLNGTDVLEITSGTSEGWWSTVVSSTASSVTVSDAFPLGLPTGTAVSVRKHNTLKNYMGANTPGLITFNGADPNDEVQILNPLTSEAKPYAYVSGADLADPLNPDGAWFDLGASAVANDQIIEPGSAIKIKRVGLTALTFTSSGTVKTTKTQVDLYPDYNWVGSQIANGSTLNGMQFHTQLVQYDGASATYDELQFVRTSQLVDPFAAIADDGSGNPTMYSLGFSVDAGTEPFPEGTGVIIKRMGSPASTITIPGTVVAP